MKTKTSLALAVLLLAPVLLASGCAKKQLVTQGQGDAASKDAATVQGPGAGTPGAPGVPGGRAAPGARPSETPSASTPDRSTTAAPEARATPPKGSAALEPAPQRAAVPQGLARDTTAGLQRVYFGFDQAVLTPLAVETLGQNAKYLKDHAAAKVRIEGHCDERGTSAYNLALGEKRAKATYQHLVDLGIDPARMTVVSYGKESPLDASHNEEAWAKNRRAELVQLGK